MSIQQALQFDLRRKLRKFGSATTGELLGAAQKTLRKLPEAIVQQECLNPGRGIHGNVQIQQLSKQDWLGN
ncbi:hypothetical protein ACNJUI_21130, partial [Mycobacterium tuberculosis]